MEDTVSGVVLLAMAAVVLGLGAAMGMATIPSATVFFVAVAVLFMAVATWLFVRAYRRQAWRRRDAERTGRPLVRAWERTPDDR